MNTTRTSLHGDQNAELLFYIHGSESFTNDHIEFVAGIKGIVDAKFRTELVRGGFAPNYYVLQFLLANEFFTPREVFDKFNGHFGFDGEQAAEQEN